MKKNKYLLSLGLLLCNIIGAVPVEEVVTPLGNAYIPTELYNLMQTLLKPCACTQEKKGTYESVPNTKAIELCKAGVGYIIIDLQKHYTGPIEYNGEQRRKGAAYQIPIGRYAKNWEELHEQVLKWYTKSSDHNIKGQCYIIVPPDQFKPVTEYINSICNENTRIYTSAVFNGGGYHIHNYNGTATVSRWNRNKKMPCMPFPYWVQYAVTITMENGTLQLNLYEIFQRGHVSFWQDVWNDMKHTSIPRALPDTSIQSDELSMHETESLLQEYIKYLSDFLAKDNIITISI